MSHAVGTRLGSYEIVVTIGVGAMGEVYRAKDLKLGRVVAVKVLPPELARDLDRLRRFEQEARAASALNHPNIVHIYDIGNDADNHFIVMELVEGTTLRQLLRGVPVDTKRLLGLARQIAAGLANAHEAGIVHRDIKPENIMVTPDGFVKILDFGLAKPVTPREPHSEMATWMRLGTRHGALIGTVEYMSPEQAAGKAVDHRSDQFSLGLILYEMATGKMAFRRETAAQTLASIIENEPPAIPTFNPKCPEGLSRVIRRCLDKAAGARYDTTAELARDLESVSEKHALPPIPPVPQNPKPDIAPLGRSFAAFVGSEIHDALDEVSREMNDAWREEAKFVLQRADGKSSTITEKGLRKKLRRHQLSGAELVRRADDDDWIPLSETPLFQQEVPVRGDPTDRSRKRTLGKFLRHAFTFVTFGAVWFLVAGEVPFWMAFWGIGLAIHAASALPAALPRNRRVLPSPASESPAVRHEPAAAPPEEVLSPAFRGEVERVRNLLNERGGDGAASLVAEVDHIVARITELATKRRDLVEQTSAQEREQLANSLEDAERKLIEATSPDDRRLYQRQFDVLRQRQRGIEKALVVVERLAIRRGVAENQLKQLRLELSRADAGSASVPELSSRLEDIRHEVDARELVDEAIANELLS
jgi:serine/threonine protein kinase